MSNLFKAVFLVLTVSSYAGLHDRRSNFQDYGGQGNEMDFTPFDFFNGMDDETVDYMLHGAFGKFQRNGDTLYENS